MARDYTRYIYPTVPILIGSPLYRALMDDLQRNGKKQIPTFIESRLERYYEGAFFQPVQSAQVSQESVAQEAAQEAVPQYIEGDVDLIDAADVEWPA